MNQDLSHAQPTPPTPIGVWLEPGYDHGRWGAWLLDWPGCFTWGRTRDGALARVPLRAGAIRGVAGAPRGATARSRPVGGTCRRGGRCRRRRRATSATRRSRRTPQPSAEDELERSPALDRVRARRPDEVAGRVAAFEERRMLRARERGNRRQWRGGAEDGRAARAVIRHVAGAETWLTSRLDRCLRFDGADPDRRPRRLPARVARMGEGPAARAPGARSWSFRSRRQGRVMDAGEGPAATDLPPARPRRRARPPPL